MHYQADIFCLLYVNYNYKIWSVFNAIICHIMFGPVMDY